MTHDEALARDAADAYVRRQLEDAARLEFEEHYFSCDACFADVQAADALRASVRSAVDRGGLPLASRPVWPRGRWMLPYAASALLAAGLGWSLFVKQPALESEVTAVTAERDALRQASRSAPDPVAPPARAEANVPIVFLEAERGTAATGRIEIPAGASKVVLVIAAPDGGVRLDLHDDSGAIRETISGLTRNAHGAYAAALPSQLLPAGRYRVRLYAAGSRLMGEYVLEVSHPR